ncbi:MAG: hypothetical protein M5U34_41135 [Chloroflexi bacterium]|nr:hypothetical protein [Chloroflexota bacterium]
MVGQDGRYGKRSSRPFSPLHQSDPAPTPQPPTDDAPTILQTGMNINPDAPSQQPGGQRRP